MIAPREIPPSFAAWNKKWGAPHGRSTERPGGLTTTRMGLRRRGPFAWQANNGTRSFEYPWAYWMVNEQGSGLKVVEIGGGLSGLQFVLAREGHHVTNIDPGQSEHNWIYERPFHAKLCHAFDAPVNLVATTINGANIPDHSVDVLLSISALEHFSDAAIAEFARHAARMLKPRALAVLTVDLFLDAAPFSPTESNQFGRNINIHKLMQDAGLELVSGNYEELMGFPEFDNQTILTRANRYLRGFYEPALAQCFTARHV
jgi:2-polyprenyl-3-methyl-5-hydroxy-6-metoxy-1,4-benzoquinol methylase